MQSWQANQPIQNGRFIIQKVIGSGGFGITYSAIEQFTGKLFVIKTLNQQQQHQADFEERQVKFVNEALILKSCKHSHIVQVYELIKENRLWGMVMEYIDGKDLGVYVDEHGPLPEDEALCYIDQIGQALEYIHQQKFLHRDVKPNNILLRADQQETVLIDFGLAREFTIGQIGSMTNAKTEGYAPIEQYERQGKFGDYTDVYALAATLYTLLTNVVPFPANYRQYAQLSPPKQYNSRISYKVNNAIVQGMALEPQDRPPTVRKFRELLGLATTLPMQPSLVDQPSPSVSNLNYPKLEEFLRANKWKEADDETYLVMLQAVDRQNEGWMRAEELCNFPCAVLCKIDQLWVEYSDGKFGLSVQQRIWGSVSDSPNSFDISTFYKFGGYVGWLNNNEWLSYNNFIFSLEAQEGHLPSFGYGVQSFHEWQLSYQYLLPRINSCLLNKI
ncbi:serine/threonine-protein kinase [Nostoc sp. FACHB-190]|uniref:serine/threonine-protein kinase n=1 Tax=Nostoc sp. FACHB-190 TaxID=2692838 RepID=UPI001686CFE8|nr:serine/threonine-protein kinase [Nostoc sp. FACHB-190]MBD2297234.1 GUN4 domain-containing protein [Nostoc sp. FACHB-190]